MVPFSFQGCDWHLVEGAALFLPSEDALLVADLHLEKASWFAARGQMLPPYDSRETLDRLARIIGLTGARRIFCLGDNFHDNSGEGRLEAHAGGMLSALTSALDWTWVCGNHDQALSGRWGGRVVNAASLGQIRLLHQFDPSPIAQICGHYHPVVRVATRQRSVSRPCLVSDGYRLILPAFGSLTGGWDACDSEIVGQFTSGEPKAYVPANGRMLCFPLGASKNKVSADRT